MRAYERFLNYVKIYTTSEVNSDSFPSSRRQFDLAGLLVEELKAMGVTDACVDEKCYVYASIPATEGCENQPAIGFLSHIDTSPDFCGEHVKPQVYEEYDGSDVILGESGRVLSVEQFPHLLKLRGRTLITTDGTTLLGADDKAGVAEIMTMAEEVIKSGQPHGKICIGFTPDEEVGDGASKMDLQRFGARFAYTVDGGSENEIAYETFNACSAKFTVHGFNIHPGYAENKMINAALVAMEINGMLPCAETPRYTERYEGFYHLMSMQGTVDEATLFYIVRDHSSARFESRQATLRHIEEFINKKYGEGTVTLELCPQYRNMAEQIAPCMHLIEFAKEAITDLGMEPDVAPVRGGTDGAMLSFRGLPCPNLGTGAFASHGPYEHITAESMDAVVKVIMGIIHKYALAKEL